MMFRISIGWFLGSKSLHFQWWENHHFESCKTNSLQGTSPYPTLGKRKSSNQKCRLVISSLEGIMPNYLNKRLSPWCKFTQITMTPNIFVSWRLEKINERFKMGVASSEMKHFAYFEWKETWVQCVVKICFNQRPVRLTSGMISIAWEPSSQKLLGLLHVVVLTESEACLPWVSRQTNCPKGINMNMTI